MEYTFNDFKSTFERNLNLALQQFPYDNYRFNRWSCHCWPQTWGSTACGAGGMGGAAITTALTMVVMCPVKAFVFHNGRMAHEFDLTDEEEKADFDKFFEKKQFPGGGDYKTKLYKKREHVAEQAKARVKAARDAESPKKGKKK